MLVYNMYVIIHYQVQLEHDQVQLQHDVHTTYTHTHVHTYTHTHVHNIVKSFPSGSGKSYTVMGYEHSLGIVPRFCEELIQKVNEDKENVSEQIII